MTDAPKSPEPTEPEPEPGTAPAAPEASVRQPHDGAVARTEPESEASHPKVARMDIDPERGEHLETELTSDAVSVRRAPRYPAFIIAGIVLGALVALVLTFAYPENGQFDRGQVFGFLLLWCAAFGAALGGVVALIIDRRLSKRSGSAVAEHESTHFVEDDDASR